MKPYLSLKTGDMVVFDGYRGDGEARTGVAEGPIRFTKKGGRVVTLRVMRNGEQAYRAYDVDECLNIRKAKS